EEPAGRQGGEEPAGRQGGEEPAGRQGGEDLAGRQGVDLAHLGEGASSKRPGEEEPARQAEDPLGRIRSLLARRQIAKARGLLDAHLVRRPDDVRARMLLGDALRLGGQGAEALEAYRDVARRSRDAHLVEAAVYEMGLLQLHALGSPADALDTFTRLRKMQPGGLLRQELAFRLAECFLALDDFRRAERALRDYLRTYPQGVKAAEARALLDELHEKGWR
ncbi:MAG: tetratricopeptide repeat protein, partial [Deltaproteobacteria bacterium]|nr:tetratricopeptide repeat protein [Deltaproteobacteria bacterium]